MHRIFSSSSSSSSKSSLKRGNLLGRAGSSFSSSSLSSSSSSSSFLGHDSSTRKIKGNHNHQFLDHKASSIRAFRPQNNNRATTVALANNNLNNNNGGRRRTISSSFSTTSWFFYPKLPLLPNEKLRDHGDKQNKILQQPQQPLQQQEDINHVLRMVQAYDPAAMLPGRLLPTPELQLAYFAIRSFWVETGLRFDGTTTAHVPLHSTPAQHLDWWSQGITTMLYPTIEEEQQQQQNDAAAALFQDKGNSTSTNQQTFHTHPTLRLLQYLKYTYQMPWSKCHFDDIVLGRRTDLDLKQYPDLDSLVQHALWSCGSLSQLVLESAGYPNTTTKSTSGTALFHTAAQELGIAHGLANALRLSIPIVSTTGKLIIPQDLCVKYGVQSPRYLLSALGQGDQHCKQQLARAVEEIATVALDHLTRARSHRDAILAVTTGSSYASAGPGAGGTTGNEMTAGAVAVKVLLPGLTSETFLKRLEHVNHDLTNADLRRVSWWEHAQCAGRIILASYQQRY
jgi:phytoene/squalene synthetase